MSVAVHRRRPLLGTAVLLAGALILLLALISIGSFLYYKLEPAQIVEPAPTPIPLLLQPIAAGPGHDELARGRYLAVAGDCVSCHTRAGGQPFAGGLGLRTPFGVIYSPNITSDRSAGIGAWTPAAFSRALHDGVDDQGHHLYPAFPYTHFTNITRPDADAILAYLKTTPPDGYAPPGNRLPFPLNLRPVLIVWNAINFHPHAFQDDPGQSAAWNRGAYLVQGLEHCGSCHTPKTLMQAEKTSRAFQGAKLDNWLAPDLTGNPRIGLGGWSVADIVEYLKTGRNGRANAGGQMAEVVSYSTSQLSDADLSAIATYIKSVKPSPDANPPAASAAAMRAGGAIYADACTGCHRVDGRGVPRLFPALPGNASLQQADPTTTLHVILAGARTGPTPTRPSTPSMPSFAWKLTNQQIADVATYVRNSWGNRSTEVSVGEVSKMRGALISQGAPMPTERQVADR